MKFYHSWHHITFFILFFLLFSSFSTFGCCSLVSYPLLLQNVLKLLWPSERRTKMRGELTGLSYQNLLYHCPFHEHFLTWKSLRHNQLSVSFFSLFPLLRTFPAVRQTDQADSTHSSIRDDWEQGNKVGAVTRLDEYLLAITRKLHIDRRPCSAALNENLGWINSMSMAQCRD